MNLPRFISGEMHYPRIPPEYWRARMQMARAMGLNAVSTYVFWNRHEPAQNEYDFSAENDVARYIRTAQEEGLDVILRPGPYVCAEWEFGGLPAWLLSGDRIAVRTRDTRFMQPVRKWLRRLGAELAPLQRAHGGPIIAVQLENEYGAFGSDAAYLAELRDIYVESGFGQSPMFTIDQPGDLANGCLDGIPIAATFAPGDSARNLRAIADLRPGSPAICGEYWAGWFEHWGEEPRVFDDEEQARDLEWMLANDTSVNIYMFHGGTNFGLWNGANSQTDAPYQPTTTSYDYQAALNEAGRPAPKFSLFRDAIRRVTGIEPPAIPQATANTDIAPFLLRESAALDSLLSERLRFARAPHMEALGQSLGYVLYRTQLTGPVAGDLTFEAVRDYAVVSLNGRIAGYVDRRRGEAAVRIACEAPAVTLDVLVENSGRINYGPALPFERKGIQGAVCFNGAALEDWEVFSLPLGDLTALQFGVFGRGAPAFYRGSFQLGKVADTFIDTSDLGKGVLWINGRCAGRFWDIGPQRKLYVPAPWLHAGRNEVVAFDLFERTQPPQLRGLAER